MSRRYGPIGTSVWDSEKFLELENDSHRLGYLYLIACPHGNSLGVFRLPTVYFAADRRKTPEEAQAMLTDMESVGLIERGQDETIRVRRWFYNDTGANNPSTASSFCKVFKDTRLVKRGPLRLAALLEMVMATLEKAEAWNPETKPFGQMVTDIQNLLMFEAKRDCEAVRDLVRSYPEPSHNSVLHMVLDMVWNTVWGHGVVHVYDIETRETDTETDTDTTSDTDTDNGHVGGKNQGAALSAPPSPPPDGRRSGRGKVDDDTQRTIDELSAKARQQNK